MKKSMYAKLSALAIVLFTLINTSNLYAQEKADAIIGVWETETKDAKMEIFKSGKEYQAKLLWGKDIVHADGTSKKDAKNPDAKLRNRDLVGITYITGLKFDDDEWEKGRVYNNSNGKWYKCYVWLEDGQLHLRGYLGMRILGQTSKWNRVK
jgi:uncharacterized protein (DUF2147 family)